MQQFFKSQIRQKALELCFDLVGFSPAKIQDKYREAFKDWLNCGREADMAYMQKIEYRMDLEKVLPGAKSVICLATNYYYEQPALKRGHGRVARYAYGRDYHKVIGKRLKKLEQFIHELGAEVLTKSYVDTGPVLERALAEQAGLGRIGKNSLLITKEFGSWVLLSEIITNLELASMPASPNSPTSFSPAIPAASKVHASTAASSIPSSTATPQPSFSISPTTTFSQQYNFDNTAKLCGTKASSHTADNGLKERENAGALEICNEVTGKKNLQNSEGDQVCVEAYPPGRQTTVPPPDRWQNPQAKSFNICGNCTRCIDACPTGAIIAPGVVDARLCISYLTIENRGKIPHHLAKIIKKTKLLFGCDICQAVCPHNEARQKESFKINTSLSLLSGSPIASDQLPLKPLQKIRTDVQFLKLFAGSPLMRAKRKGLQRNAEIIASPPRTKGEH